MIQVKIMKVIAEMKIIILLAIAVVGSTAPVKDASNSGYGIGGPLSEINCTFECLKYHSCQFSLFSRHECMIGKGCTCELLGKK